MSDKQEVETWKPVERCGNKYEVSNLGNIRFRKNKHMRKIPVGKRGYPVFSYRINGIHKLTTVHRCVAEAFIPNPDNKKEINHIDGNKSNNNVSNLEWVTSRENCIHARETGLHTSDGQKPVAMILDDEIIAVFGSAVEAARETGIHRSGIGSAIYKRCYRGHRHLRAGGYEWKFL